MNRLTRTLRLFFAVFARALSREARREPDAAPVATAYGWPDIALARRDFGVVVFGLLALSALVASVPYTYAKVATLHALNEIGIAQSIGSLLVFEAGAFLAKVATLFIPQWRGRLNATQVGLLLIVCAANYQTARAGAPGASSLEIGVYVALMPLIQWLFLGLAVARAETLHKGRIADAVLSPAEQALARFETLRDRFWTAHLERTLALMDEQSQRSTLALPAQPLFPVPTHQRTQPVAMPSFVCDGCGAEATPHQRRGFANLKAWVCKGCGKRHEA